ncbi:hypothetical protein HYH03_018456 [Edaphochlamys debaryana]|uniref:Carboxypeptidase n=1 Tax=Edaphochlamys debaryana TaxID=47281 RepID=A0A835XDQ8_9CHLO|nr:hypothetical protein HYH03_018456 [Edaphochlamys debaryana]|eukprot:KAG2482612.1 hypothetical protein HYH03_018456 [Edaphochlamys debaryana]
MARVVLVTAVALLALAGIVACAVQRSAAFISRSAEDGSPSAPDAASAAALNPACAPPDEVCFLPGLRGAPHVRMRSGYVTVSEPSGRKLWYLVADRETQQPSTEAEAEVEVEAGVGKGGRKNDDQASPVVLWLTGGPGCSSLDAFIHEHGPFSFSYGPKPAAGGGAEREVVLSPNPHAWTKAATMIYVDSPAGAGMSYSNNTDDYHTNDKYTIADLMLFLEGLTERYPELATAPFYLSGESYGGVYVPLLAAALLDSTKKRSGDGKPALVNLQGVVVGNPVTDDTIDGNAQLQYGAAMGFIDPDVWARIRITCNDMFWNASYGSDCWEAQEDVKDDLWDLNWYDVLQPCLRGEEAFEGGAAALTEQHTAQSDQRALADRFFWPFTVRMEGHPEDDRGSSLGDGAAEAQQGMQAEAAVRGPARALQEETERRGGRRLWGERLRYSAPCLEHRLSLDWLNREDVRAALHARPTAGWEWQPCSDLIYYRLDTMALVPYYERFVREGLRVLVYSGDHDMVVPHIGTRTWLYDKADLGGREEPLRTWRMKGQVAGWTTRFKAGSRLTFATVKGAGHMVPSSKPAEMLYLLQAFLQDKDL